MRRRFGRGRKRNEGAEATPIDAARALSRILEVGAVDATRLEPIEVDGIPDHFAALGVGESAAGRPVVLAFAPERGGDAALAALALGARREAEGAEAGSLYALAPDWSGADRRRLALLAPRLPLEAVAASALAENGVRVGGEPGDPVGCEPELLAGALERSGERAVFSRALTALDGLAAKHGGALRGVDDRAELVILARRTASLVAEPGRVRIEVHEPDRATLALSDGDGLATALDRLEGLLRKLLNDRRLRTSEAGLRAALAPVLERAAEVVAIRRWPLPGSDGDGLDWIGLDAAGRTVCGAARETLGLPGLAAILDAAGRADPVARLLAREAGRAPRPDPPRLALAATEFESPALEACAAMGLAIGVYDASTRRNGEWALEARTLGERGQAAASAPAPPVATPHPDRESPRSGRGGRSRSGGRPAAAEDATAETVPAAEAAPDPAPARFEEVSLFELDEEAPTSEGGGESDAGRRRRGRGRRRGRRGRGGESGRGERPRADEGEASSDDSPRGRSTGSRRRRAAPAEPEENDDDDPLLEGDDEETLAPLAADAPELDEESEAPGYDDEDEGDGDEEDAKAERARLERERRRRERAAKPPEPPPPPRRRAAFLAHADPVSVLTAAVLARDVRLVDSFWIYPQSELMTFFRSVATDLKEQSPIFLVGFAASPPARDTFQSASLYRGRLDWFDHHDWPPEDLETLRATLGAEHVHVTPGAESSLAAVIAARTRRSRFSDKLVELITGRFSQHDYERWGRWWWHRAAELSTRHGDRRAEIEPLLAGRPSDLARSVAESPEPPLPSELAYVAERDFRLVHFGGFSMVVLAVPPEIDLHLAARIARERYEAQLSLATRPGDELVVLGGDDSRVKRGLDLGGMTEHLATKHAWITALPDDDHVARMRVHRLHDEPGRFDELITEIAMGRSIVEG